MATIIREVELLNFRNHKNRKINNGNVFNILVGKNGTGKTSILESISLLSIGKNLRNSTNEEILMDQSIVFNSNCDLNKEDLFLGWQAKYLISDSQNFNNYNNIDISYTKSDKKRNISSNGKKIKNKESLAYLPFFIYLTPENETVFSQTPANRRSFIDRLIHPIFPQHGKLLLKQAYYAKSRMQILKNLYSGSISSNNGISIDKWLSSIEKSLAEISFSIYMNRSLFCSMFSAYMRKSCFSCTNGGNSSYIDSLSFEKINIFSNIPKMRLSYISNIDHLSKIIHLDSLCNEGDQRAQIIKSIELEMINKREMDFIIKKNTIGVSADDFDIVLNDRFSISNCSMGEQKMCVISLIIAYIKWIREFIFIENIQKYTSIDSKEIRDRQFIILLDDIISHLDDQNQLILLSSLAKEGISSWITLPTPHAISCIINKFPALINIINLD